jgi:uroporphyrinogen-III synthase
MKGKILVTANRDLASVLFDEADVKPLLKHLPLETYTEHIDVEGSAKITGNPNLFQFVIHGNLRNTRFFLDWMTRNGLTEIFQKMVHLTVDKPTAKFLEKNHIPAILPAMGRKPIDILEFMLRISREGAAIYPSSDGEQEEMPALLQELDMPVYEFTVCREVPITEDNLNRFRNEISNARFSHILIHNRSSLTRLRTAFPELDLKKYELISGSAGVSRKLTEDGLEPVAEADGTWLSVCETIKQKIL